MLVSITCEVRFRKNMLLLSEPNEINMVLYDLNWHIAVHVKKQHIFHQAVNLNLHIYDNINLDHPIDLYLSICRQHVMN